MKLNKQRKACLAVLTLAGVALFTDRFILADSTGPAAAKADSLLITKAAADGPSTDAAVPTHEPLPAPAIEVITVADRLVGMGDKEPAWKTASADAFAIPLAWGNPFAQEHPDAAAPKLQSISPGSFRLTSVLKVRSDGTLIAVINGRPFHVDEEIDGLTVARITAGSSTSPGSAVLSRNGDEIELTIQPPATGHTRLTVSQPTVPKGESAQPFFR